jgi:MIP family channel proteins
LALAIRQVDTEELTSPDALKAAAAELFATAIFVMVGVGAIAAFVASQGEATALADGVPSIAIAHGLTIALLAAGIAAMSGGHINPAVTFAMVLAGQTNPVRGGMYIVAQVIGACIGALLLRAFVNDIVLEAIPGGGGNAIASQVVGKSWHGLFLEALGTFVWVWTVFAVAVSPRGNAGTLAPLYIGFAVLVIHIFLVPFTGAGINPARTFGPALFLPGAADGIPGRWDDFWIYYIGPLLGAAAAALLYYALYLMPFRSESGTAGTT